MRVIGCCNAYQEAELLEACLTALRPLVDLLVVVDGAYRDFPWYGNSPESTDGSLALAQKLADVVVRCPLNYNGTHRVPWTDEIKKRSQYLIGWEGDYYLVVDADEMVEGTFDRAHVCLKQDWGVMLYREEQPSTRYPIHRLFMHRDGIHYRGTHHAVHVGDTLLHPDKVVKIQENVFPGLTLRHTQCRRSLERSERKGTYYRELEQTEKAFRQQAGL